MLQRSCRHVLLVIFNQIIVYFRIHEDSEQPNQWTSDSVLTVDWPLWTAVEKTQIQSGFWCFESKKSRMPI